METEVSLGVSLPLQATHILPYAPLLGMSATCRGGGGGGERWGGGLLCPPRLPLEHYPCIPALAQLLHVEGTVLVILQLYTLLPFVRVRCS